MRTIDAVLFDKTGTLSTGTPAVIDVVATDDTEEGRAQLLALAGAVESDSEHPLVKAIVAAAKERSTALPTATDFHSLTARGVQATVEGTHIAIGGPALLRETGAQIPDALAAQVQPRSDRGAAVLSSGWMRSSPRCCRRTGTPRSPTCKPGGCASPWSATGSMTPPPLLALTSGLLSGPGRRGHRVCRRRPCLL